MASILPNGKCQFIDQNGKPLVGGTVTFYAPGTTTKKDTWQDSSMTQPNTNPLVLDSRGQATIWGSGDYRQVVRDVFGVTIWDNIVNDVTLFTQSGPGAVPTTIENILRLLTFPQQFATSITDFSGAFSSAAASQGGVKVPPGNYPILSSIDLTGAALDFDRGARLLPAAGVTVSLGSISAGLYQIFAGSGSCTVSGLTERVYPEWWGAIGDGATADHVAVKASIDNSAAFGNIATLTRKYGLGARLEVNPAAQIDSSRASSFASIGGQPDAVVLMRGNMTGRQVLPSIGGFSGCQLEVRCSLGNPYIRQLNGGGTPIRFQAGGAGATANVLDTIVQFDSISNASNIPVEFAFNYPTDVIQGCGVVGNFITESKNAVAFTGVAAFDDGLFCDIYALDITEGGGAMLDNRIAGHSVPRFTMRVRSWLGGAGFSDPTNPTQLAKGQWNNIEIDVVNSNSFTQSNLAYGLVTAARIKERQWLSLGGRGFIGSIGYGAPRLQWRPDDAPDEFFRKDCAVCGSDFRNDNGLLLLFNLVIWHLSRMESRFG